MRRRGSLPCSRRGKGERFRGKGGALGAELWEEDYTCERFWCTMAWCYEGWLYREGNFGEAIEESGKDLVYKWLSFVDDEGVMREEVKDWTARDWTDSLSFKSD